MDFMSPGMMRMVAAMWPLSKMDVHAEIILVKAIVGEIQVMRLLQLCLLPFGQHLVNGFLKVRRLHRRKVRGHKLALDAQDRRAANDEMDIRRVTVDREAQELLYLCVGCIKDRIIHTIPSRWYYPRK